MVASSSAASGGGCNLETGPPCNPMPVVNPGQKSTVDTITARVLDTDNNPVDKILFDVCGTDQCLSGESESDGKATVMGMGKELTDVHMIYGHGDKYVQWAAPIPQSNDFGDIHAVPFPSHSEGQEMCPGSTVTQGDVTLEIADPAHIKHDLISVGGDKSKHGFRSVLVQTESLNLPAVDPSAGLEIVYGLAPIHSKICPAAKMTVPNSKGWDANAEVEFFIHGTTTFTDAYIRYGEWAKISDGTVSAYGKTISTAEGGGIPVLSPVGIRLKK